MQEQDILDKIHNIREIQIIEAPKNIEIIKPIQRTPVKKDFKLEEINAAEANNKVGIAGITGKLDVKVIPVKVLDKNEEGVTNDIAKGIVYAVDKGDDVINR